MIEDTMFDNGCYAVFLEKEHDVVTCKDCIHYDSDGGAMMICDITDMVCDNDDYCSYGERREDGEA